MDQMQLGSCPTLRGARITQGLGSTINSKRSKYGTHPLSVYDLLHAVLPPIVIA